MSGFSGIDERTMSRRGFLGTAAGVAALAALRSLGGGVALAAGSCTAKVKDSQIGIQLFTCTAANYANTAITLNELASIGYQKIEHAGFGSAMTPEAFRKALDDAGIECTGGHYGPGLFPYDKKAWAQTLDDCNVVGQTYVGVAGKPSGDNTQKTWEKYADAINVAGAVAQKAGFREIYQHFHTGEWQPVDDNEDLRPVDILMRNTDPEIFHVQMDIGWAYAGLGSIDAVCNELRRYPGRFRTLHVKDMVGGAAGAGETAPVQPGYGEIGKEGFAQVFGAAKETHQGVTEYHVESDSSIATCFDSAQTGWDLLHGMEYSYKCNRP
jgi:sugar phosphate isomerase/epimerase